LVRMDPSARDELATQAQRRASELGLMRGPAPIPLVLSPCALPREELAALGRGARLITSALVKIARELIERRPERARLLFRHRSKPPSIQLLHRDGDPQVTELHALAALLRDRGIDARTCTPADIALDGDPQGVIYRHLFARYVEPSSPLGHAFLDPVRHGIWNRVDGSLETKGLFAELS